MKRIKKYSRLIPQILLAHFSFFLSSNSSNAQWFGLFGPNDYEECASAAAKDAKNNTALSILIENCAKDFPARRNGRGGYVFYEPLSQSYIDVSGPKLKEKDWKKIEIVQKQAVEKALRDAEEERKRAEELLNALEQQEQRFKFRTAEALQKLVILGKNLVPGESLCIDTKLSVNLKNNSKEHITEVTVGFSYFGAEQTYCPDSLPNLPPQKISLKPSQSGVINFDSYQLCDRARSKKYCIRINKVRIRN